jgi:hypothetical protein
MAGQRVPLVTLLALLSCPSPVLADTEYAYTKIELNKCKRTPGGLPDSVLLCPGYAGIAVRISGGEQRTYVSFGDNAKGELANRETLISPNGEGNAIEWRIETSGGSKRPFAAIMRWFTNVAGEKEGEIHRGQVLVVTRLNPGGVCHVGYVDGRANPDANELARKLADERARQFRCGKDQPGTVGRTGPGFAPRELTH